MCETDTDWGQWVDKNDDKPIDPNLNESVSSKSLQTINDLGEYEMIKIFGYFTIRERIVLSWVNTKWRQYVHQSFLSETKLDAMTFDAKHGTVQLMCHLMERFPNVRHLSLVGVSPFEQFENIKELMEAIVTNCSQLQSIDLGVLDDVLDEVFKQNTDFFLKLQKIVSLNISEEALNCIIGSNNLKSIHINKNDRISKLNFKSLGPKIREIHLIDTQISELNDIKDLCEGNGKLIEILSIDIKDKSVLPLICDNLVKLKEMKICLYIENCYFTQFENLKELKCLQIAAKDSIFRSEEFMDLIRALRVTRISDMKIELSSMNNIAVTDKSLKEMQTNCHFIERLEIRGANSLTGSGMYYLAQMSNLRHLNLKRCVGISDQVEIVITSCPLLRDLIVHSCPHITNTVVNAFIEKAKSLPNEHFFLDVIDTNVCPEIVEQTPVPHNLNLLCDIDNCSYSSCEHGWGADGYNSGPEDYEHVMDDYEDYDFYGDEDDDDYYDDYGDETIDIELS